MVGVAALALLFSAAPVLAQSPIPEPRVTSLGDFYTILRAAAQWVLVFGILGGVLFVAIGGVKILSSGGDEKKLASGKATLTWALVGIAILVLAYSIVNVLAFFLGSAGPVVRP